MNKIKPKEILVNLPAVHLFATEDEIPNLAAAINTIINGKIRVKCEVLGTLGGQFVGLFYLKRNTESQQLHDQFVKMIEAEEAECGGLLAIQDDGDEDDLINEEVLITHSLCQDCDNTLLHLKGLEHCICGADWIHRKCEEEK